jgi:galactonate dehydratase
MRITWLEPIVVEVTERGDWVFVLVHTDAGITGLGEASHSLNDALLVATLETFADRITGEDPLAIRKIWRMLSGVGGGRITHTAVSAIDQALWDILGQHLGVPIHALFGGAVRRKLRLYANINRHVRDRSPEGFAAAARQAVDEGFTAVKLAPFDELRGPDHVRTGPKAAWRTGVDRVCAVRAAIGDEIDLAIDCHGRMEASEAIVVGRELESCDLMWYEEPVKHTFPDQLALISRSVPMPTASAESIFSVEGFRSFLLERVVDVLMPDVKHCGGL